eukprot:1933152-Amphidinium_carterae.2
MTAQKLEHIGVDQCRNREPNAAFFDPHRPQHPHLKLAMCRKVTTACLAALACCSSLDSMRKMGTTPFNVWLSEMRAVSFLRDFHGKLATKREGRAQGY